AAHCLTKSGTATVVDGVKVYPPGIAIAAFSNIQPNASPIAVIGINRPDGYASAGPQVNPNDIAALVLASDLAPSAGTRLASTAEADRLAQQGAPVTMIGYGQAGPGVDNNVPNAVSLPITGLRPDSTLGDVFLVSTTDGRDACPGDSGAPVFATGPSGTLLLGTQAGASGPCFGRTEGATINFLAMGYLDVLNAALAQAGYPLVPGPAQGLQSRARNRDVTVAWEPPAIAPGAVVDYEVIGSDGSIGCSTAATSCTVSDLPDGRYAFTVRSRNVQGEGDAPLAAQSVLVAGPHRMARPWIRKGRIAFRSLVGTSSAVVERYQVRDQRGRIVCTVVGRRAKARVPTCSLPKARGAYRFRVRAVTEMGTTAWSPRTKIVRVS
ncbi:MAG: fibronectin type III domain-containing protein, partial [Actinomycetales bacterium]